MSLSSLISLSPVNDAAVGNAKALYDFDSALLGDLAFKAGDVIALLMSDKSEDWWIGTLRGKTGIFPQELRVSPQEHSGSRQ